MANFAIQAATDGDDAISYDWNQFAGDRAKIPALAWPATGGGTHTQRNMNVFLPLVDPLGSLAAGGPTTGQLFPVGNR